MTVRDQATHSLGRDGFGDVRLLDLRSVGLDGVGNGCGYHAAGVLHGGDGLVIAAGERVVANDGHLFKHLHAVFQVAHAAALVMAPGDGNFNDGVAKLTGDEEDLRIESPALDALQAEDDLGGLTPEGLEAALGVFERQAHHAAGNAIEAAAKDLAVERLLNGLAGAIHPAGAYGNVSAGVNGGEKAVGLFHGCGEVGVSEHNDVARGLQETIADGVAFAAIARIFDQVETRVEIHPALYDGDGLIFRAIIDDQNFGVPALCIDAVHHALERCFNARALIISRNNDTQLWMRHAAHFLF